MRKCPTSIKMLFLVLLMKINNMYQVLQKNYERKLLMKCPSPLHGLIVWLDTCTTFFVESANVFFLHELSFWLLL